MNLGLRPDVDSAGGLVHDEKRRAPPEPLREHDLLLVAAGQRRHRAREPAVLDLEARRPVTGEPALARGADEAEASKPPQRRERDVAADRHLHHEPLLAAVLRHEADAGFHRPRWGCGPQRLAPEQHAAAVVAIDSEDRARDLAAAGADEPCERDDLP